MDNIKLICVDLDGTLLNDDKEFTDFSKSVIAKARSYISSPSVPGVPHMPAWN